MDNNKLLPALSYFSVLFAPFILPIIVYFVVQESDVKRHAQRALISQIFPFALSIITTIILLGFTFSASSSTNNFEENWMPVFFLIIMIINIIVGFATLIWNIIQGVKVLR